MIMMMMMMITKKNMMIIIQDNLKAKELIDLLPNVVQVAVDPPQDVQLVGNFFRISFLQNLKTI